MWAQLVIARLKPGKEDDMRAIEAEFESRARAGRVPWERSIVLQNENDPQEYYNLVFFESEEKARENENTPEQQELVQRFQALFDGPPRFVDLIPTYEGSR